MLVITNTVISPDPPDASPSLVEQRLLIRALIPRRLEPKLRNLLTQRQSIFEPAQLCSKDIQWLGIGESKRDAQVAKLDVVRKYDIDDASLLLRQCSRSVGRVLFMLTH